jgi:hypothetical protein
MPPDPCLVEVHLEQKKVLDHRQNYHFHSQNILDHLKNLVALEHSLGIVLYLLSLNLDLQLHPHPHHDPISL